MYVQLASLVPIFTHTGAFPAAPVIWVLAGGAGTVRRTDANRVGATQTLSAVCIRIAAPRRRTPRATPPAVEARLILVLNVIVAMLRAICDPVVIVVGKGATEDFVAAFLSGVAVRRGLSSDRGRSCSSERPTRGHV